MRACLRVCVSACVRACACACVRACVRACVCVCVCEERKHLLRNMTHCSNADTCTFLFTDLLMKFTEGKSVHNFASKQ